MRHLILLICMPAYAHPLTCCLLPPPLSFSLDEEVANNKEGNSEECNTNDTDADNTDAATDNATPDNDVYITMPPKVKPVPT